MSDEQTKIPGAYPNTPSANEGQFSTPAHPAPENIAGAPLSGIFSAAPGPVIPNEETARNLEKPLGREELQVLEAALNKKE